MYLYNDLQQHVSAQWLSNMHLYNDLQQHVSVQWLTSTCICLACKLRCSHVGIHILQTTIVVYLSFFQAEQEAEEAAETKKSLGMGDDDDSLKALIQRKQQSREQGMTSFFDQLEAKYAPPKKGKKGESPGGKKTKNWG